MKEESADGATISRAVAQVGRGALEAAGLNGHGGRDQVGDVVCHVHVRRQAEEDVAVLALAVLLAPDPAVAERRNGVDASVQRNTLLTGGLDDGAFAGFLADLDISQREVMLVEEFSDLDGSRERLLFGAAVLYCFGSQCLDTRLETVVAKVGGSALRSAQSYQDSRRRTGTHLAQRDTRPRKSRMPETTAALHIHNERHAESATFPASSRLASVADVAHAGALRTISVKSMTTGDRRGYLGARYRTWVREQCARSTHRLHGQHRPACGVLLLTSVGGRRVDLGRPGPSP